MKTKGMKGGMKPMSISQMMHPDHMPGMTPVKIMNAKKASSKGKKSKGHGY